jgi:hypothetical protein
MDILSFCPLPSNSILHVNSGRDISQAVRCWLLSAEPRFQSQVTSCEILGGRIGTTAGLSPGSIGFSVLIIILPLLHTDLSPRPEVCDSPDQAAHSHNLSL